jgi:hypothetical protein
VAEGAALVRKFGHDTQGPEGLIPASTDTNFDLPDATVHRQANRADAVCSRSLEFKARVARPFAALLARHSKPESLKVSHEAGDVARQFHAALCD